LYIKHKNWPDVQDKILKSNLFQARTVSTLKRICNEVISRLKLLAPEQLEIINKSTAQDQTLMLWIAVCRRYDFIRDFAVEVIREKYLIMDYSLTQQDYTIFFNTKAHWHEELENLKDSTKKKLKQVLFKMLREAEIISRQNIIIPSILSKSIARALFNDKSGIYMVLPISDNDFKERAK
ncbi:DUF1819 family protein, partial [Desulfobacterales bacterium HSG17]|nr:DUF1819 family protein [Desulfobacterales bacterium HSG17]